MIDFFSAAHIVQNRMIALERADRLPDFGLMLDQLRERLDSAAGGGDSVVDAAAVRRNSRARQWLSRWSLRPEAAPLWQRFGPEAGMVSVATRIGKLHQLGGALLRRDGTARAPAACSARIAPVKYVDLAALAASAGKEGPPRSRPTANFLRRSVQASVAQPGYARYLGRKRRWALQALCCATHVVDAAQAHEAEVRLTLTMDQAPGDAALLWAACPPRMIEEVMIDPRCAPLQAQFMRSWFAAQGVAVRPSVAGAAGPALRRLA